MPQRHNITRSVWLRSCFCLSMAASTLLSGGCATTGATPTQEVKQAPKIERDMPLDEALKAGIDFGGDTARDVRKLISKRKEWPMAEKFLVEAIRDGIIKYENRQLINAVMLYVSGPVKPSEVLFQKMVESGRPLARQMGWQMAAALPSKAMRNAMEREINRALMEGEDADVLLPQMANAVQANRMTSAYTMVRQGLMTTGHEDFAAAMAVLNPEQASADFIDYLSLCPPEELRQLSVSTINMHAAIVALNHMVKHLPNPGHPRIDTIFFYAISRSPGLNELGNMVVEAMSAKYQQHMALTLSRQPVWIQVAYIEGARRNMNQSKKMFLSELKKISPQAEVTEELGEIKL